MFPFNTLAKQLADNPNLLATTAEEGLDKILKSNYIFLVSSESMKYVTNGNCSVAHVSNSKTFQLFTILEFFN